MLSTRRRNLRLRNFDVQTARGFKPFEQPTRPPPGYYDPAIDAQQRAGERGFEYLQQDVSRATERGQDDFALGVEDVNRQKDQSLSDLLRSHTRNATDFGQARGRLTQDRDLSLAELVRRYGELGQTQTQGASARGISSEGAFRQAAAARAGSHARDRQPVELSYGRGMEDLATREARAGEDYSQLAGPDGRIESEADRAIARLGLGFERDTQDRTTQVERGQRELTQQGVDLTAVRNAQAEQGGYIPPEAPGNEHRDPKTGQVFRLIRTPRGKLVRLLPNGQIVRRPSYSLRG
jgi:hypothetical protein